ncbi:MAG: arsenosugar biosynthesis radical SAM (seleno)protein ArsS [Acidobacteriota bacterium]
MSPEEQLRVLAESTRIPPIQQRLSESAEFPLRAREVEILQINVGRLCNLSCRHCHVEAGPARSETMSGETFDLCSAVIRSHPFLTVDITGGAPEMNPHLPGFVQRVAGHAARLIVRSNLVILLEPEYRHLIELFARNRVEIVGSLPDYRSGRTDAQRGGNVFARSVEAIRMLNDAGYAADGSDLALHLVHNPVGAYLPASQAALEREYRRALQESHGARFNHLFCFSNMPVGRFLDFLLRTDNYEDYLSTLSSAYNPAAAANVMCKATVSVDWEGRLFDCDFNQVLNLPVDSAAPSHIRHFDMKRLSGRRIVTANHCYGCTAGMGSSCQGATAQSKAS